MARVLYLDCFSGVAGDMLLAALIDAGVPHDVVRDALGSLGIDHELRISRVMRAGIAASKVDVVERAHAADSGAAPQPFTHHGGHTHPHGEHGDPRHVHGLHVHPHKDVDGHRSLGDITRLIDASALSRHGKQRAVALFQKLAEAEAAVHDLPLDQVHLHEVGAVDSIIDIVGVVAAMEWLGIDDVEASPLNVGGGTVEISHGTFPVPAPATVRLLAGVPIYSRGPRAELVTPTGALLVSGYAVRFGALPAMTVARVGYGAGTRDFAQTPNVLRVLIGERTVPLDPFVASASILKIECEIDDMNPQLFGPTMDRLFEAGAVDVFLTAVQMKKGRPGTLMTMLAPEDRREAVCAVLFRETTTIGVRFERVWRETLERRLVEVDIAGGRVRVKVSGRQGVTLNVVPEFDDCVRVAQASRQPIKDVQAEALRAWHALPEAAKNL